MPFFKQSFSLEKDSPYRNTLASKIEDMGMNVPVFRNNILIGNFCDLLKENDNFFIAFMVIAHNKWSSLSKKNKDLSFAVKISRKERDQEEESEGEHEGEHEGEQKQGGALIGAERIYLNLDIIPLFAILYTLIEVCEGKICKYEDIMSRFGRIMAFYGLIFGPKNSIAKPMAKP